MATTSRTGHAGRYGLGLLAGALLMAVLPADALCQTLGFTDVTAAAGIDVVFTGPVNNNETDLSGGIAVGDFDRDGWQDLFCLGGYAAPNELYINDGDGTFTESAAAWGIADTYAGSGIAVGDYDGDGWLDIFVTNLGMPTTFIGGGVLYRNTGGTGFVDVAAAAGVQSEAQPAAGRGAAFGDIDLDGDLDLFSSGWTGWGSLGNRLYRNDGGTFTEVTFTSFNSFGFVFTKGFTPLLVDMDFDRDPDLILVSDFLTSKYFENVGGGIFEERTDSSNTSLETNGMGTCVGDFDLDGVFDWYVTSIKNDPGTGSGTGNMFYRGLGDHVFQEMSHAAGLNDGGWGWGVVAIDADHDGLLDIAENNGWHHLGGYAGQFVDEQCYFWLNEGDMQFTEMAVALGLDYAEDGRGMVRFDYDNDGDMDLAFTGINTAVKLFRNDLTGPDTHWVKLFLDAGGQPGVAPDGYGSLVTADAAGHPRQMRTLDAGGSFLSQSELSVHFGLGAATDVDRLVVRWPDGHVTTLSDVPADATYTITCCGPWEDIGFALAGASGAPELLGEGELAGNDPIDLHLSNVPASTTAWMVLGLAQANIAFYGGTLVPTLAPPALQLPLPTSPAGALSVGGLWPTGVPAGLQVFFQYWVVDATGPFGFTASNALKATTP